MTQQTILECDNSDCDEYIPEHAEHVTVELNNYSNAIEGRNDTLHYCSPMCMFDNWRGRLDWYVHQKYE